MIDVGILPSNIGDVTAQRQQLTDIIVSTWPACTMPDTKVTILSPVTRKESLAPREHWQDSSPSRTS